ncbi:MAG: adenosylcobinamide-GDP ribazoletransferase [Oscillospiraceae bacterium]|nr:adenosylcobinamide-GDP ribazoletransferase [Oscillospiraceae bacterium]
MNTVETILVAFAMFSALPVPQPVWNGRNLRYTLCVFPLIGVVCGLLWWGWCAACAALAVPDLLRGAGLCLLPVLLTGGIHLDGCADTWDALACHGSPEKKQEILQDPRCGAFAVIRLCSYFILYFSLCTVLEPTPQAIASMGFAFVLERALSGLAISRFPLAKNTGLAHTFATAADRWTVGRVLTAVCVLSGLGLLCSGGLVGGGMLAGGLAVFWHYHRTADRQFGGISGDLAGWFLQRAELWMLAALVGGQRIGGLSWF